MGDDSDGQAQIMDDSGIQAKVMDMSSGSTQVNGDSAEQAQMPEDSDRQEQVMTDPTGQAKSTGDTVEQTVTSADQSPCSGVSEPFPFWRHIPPPTLCFAPRLVPYGYYGCVPSADPPPPPPPSPYGVFPRLWNGTHCGVWPVHTPQVVVGVPPPPPPEVDSSPKLSVSSCTTESHDATPMDISPSSSPLRDSMTLLGELESVTSTETAMSTTGETGEVGGTHSVKTVCLENGMLMPRALKPVKYLQAVDPRRAKSSILSLLKRCKACAKKMARAKRKGVTFTAEECTCTQKTFAPSKVECEQDASTVTAETGVKELVPPTASVASTGVRQQHVVSDAGEPMDSSEPHEPSLASTKLTSTVDCVSASAADLTEITQPPGASCTEKKSVPEESETYLIPVIEGRRPAQDSWRSQRGASRDSYIVVDSGPNYGETFSNYTHNHIPVEYLVNRFIEEIRAASVQNLCAGDSRTRVKISGAYVPGSMIDNLNTTVIDIQMDPLLGACVEHAEGPFLLPSELEEDDEGWLWTFE